MFVQADALTLSRAATPGAPRQRITVVQHSGAPQWCTTAACGRLPERASELLGERGVQGANCVGIRSEVLRNIDCSTSLIEQGWGQLQVH